MRRLLLTLTLLSVPGWSQLPAQQPAQPPIVVKVEMPPTNPWWIHLVELVVPGIIGAGLALLGVWLTNKRNVAENAANREHQLRLEIAKDKIAAEAKSRDNRWEFQKGVYTKLITVVLDLIRLRRELLLLLDYRGRIPPDDLAGHEAIYQKQAANRQEYTARYVRYITQMTIANLAMANDAIFALRGSQPAQTSQDEDSDEKRIESDLGLLEDQLRTLSNAGRKDLWGTPENEAKNEAAT